MAFPRRKTRKSKKSIPRSTSIPTVSEPPIPDHFRCPISLELMKDPVTASTGITYDRQSIERWLDLGNSTCPVTNMALSSNDLIPNHTIRRLIQDWCAVNHSHGVEQIPTPRIPITQFEAFEILSDLSSALSRRDWEQCLELTKTLRSSVKESDRNRKCFLSIGAPAVLAPAFRVSNFAVSVEILAALSGLLPFDDETTVRELGSPESLNSIMEIMAYENINSRINVVLMVKKIASTSEDLAKALAKKSSLIEALVEFIRDPISQQATKASLATLFYFTVNDEEIAKKCVNLGLTPLLLELLVDADKSMTERTLAVLDVMCGCELGREAACRHGLTIPVLAKKMFRVSEAATEFVISVLWKLCRNCEGRCLTECLQVGVLQKLVLVLQVGCGETTKEKATEMLKLMSGCSGKLECVDTLDFRGLNRQPADSYKW